MTSARIAAVAAALFALAACGSEPAKPTAAPASPTAATASPTPAAAPTPSGDRGEDWHAQNGSADWEGRVKEVAVVGLLLIVRTDLTIAEGSIAMQVCQAGHAYLMSVGAPTASVGVYSDRVRLAESKDGSPCRSAL